MTDIVACDYCQSDLGFMVDGGRVYCKSCKREHKPEPITTKEYMRSRGWLPEQRYNTAGGS